MLNAECFRLILSANLSPCTPHTRCIRRNRTDDVIPALVIALQIPEPLRHYLASKKPSQKYWYEWFAELIIDRLWDELHTPHEEEK